MRTIELLYFEGCPGVVAVEQEVERAVRELGLAQQVEVRRTVIEDAQNAGRLRFLGSPSVRVDGRDVEPGAEQRTDFGLQCRVYLVDGRLQNTPPLAWIARALGEVTG